MLTLTVCMHKNGIRVMNLKNLQDFINGRKRYKTVTNMINLVFLVEYNPTDLILNVSKSFTAKQC